MALIRTSKRTSVAANVGKFFVLNEQGASTSGQDTITVSPMYSGAVYLGGIYSSLTCSSYAIASIVHNDGTVTVYNLNPNDTKTLTPDDQMLIISRLTAGSAPCTFTLS